LECPKCGAGLRGDAESCQSCGEPINNSSAGPGLSGFAAARPSVVYAGFWLRLVAYLVDSFLLGILLSPVLAGILMNNHVQTSMQDFVKFYTGDTRQAFALQLLIYLVAWLYFASFESSAWQATLGKRMLGLRVTDLQGKRISFARASGRSFGKIISGFFFLLGFVMAAFTEKKQALHDMLAGCLVLKKI